MERSFFNPQQHNNAFSPFLRLSDACICETRTNCFEYHAKPDSRRRNKRDYASAPHASLCPCAASAAPFPWPVLNKDIGTFPPLPFCSAFCRK